jgi:hypothetical protein
MVDFTKKTTTLPSVTIDSDVMRGIKRYIFKWRGYNKEIFQALKLAGAQAEKEGVWIIWCHTDKLAACVNALKMLDINVVSSLNLDEEINESLLSTPEPYGIVNIGTMYVTIHFDYNRKMIDALKQFVPPNGREYDEYTHDWKIKHEYFSLLISAWRTLGVPVKRLEEVRQIIS